MKKQIEQAIQAAIGREIKAYELYDRAADMVKDRSAQQALSELAAQERGHRRRLELLLERGFSKAVVDSASTSPDLKITDHLVAVPLDENADLQQILIVAGKREAASGTFYAAMASISEEKEVAELFTFLADEELAHKQYVEQLYEELFYTDN